MTGPSADVIRWGKERIRAAHWRGDERVALLAPIPTAPVPSAEFLGRCLVTLRDQGFNRVMTSALSPFEQTGFLAAGFVVEERLHLLGIDLTAGLPPIPDGLPMVRGGRRRRRGVLAVDQAAFSAFWRFDEHSLREAIDATPSTRYRVAIADRQTLGEGRVDPDVVGYVVCGRAGSRGFVQRLAVDPAVRRSGTGSRLLLDGLHWMRKHGVRRAVVNTQTENTGALALYRGLGFVDEPTGLSVLGAGLS